MCWRETERKRERERERDRTSGGIQQQGAIEVGGGKGLRWRDGFRWIHQQGATEVGGYRVGGWERAVLERELRRIKQQEAIGIGAVEVRGGKELRWRDGFGGIQTQGAIEIGE